MGGYLHSAGNPYHSQSEMLKLKDKGQIVNRYPTSELDEVLLLNAKLCCPRNGIDDLETFLCVGQSTIGASSRIQLNSLLNLSVSALTKDRLRQPAHFGRCEESNTLSRPT
jgi:hypothetical protein